MVKSTPSNPRLNPKVSAENWFRQVSTHKSLNSQHREIFNTFCNSLASSDIAFDSKKLIRARATPVTRFSLHAFAKRLKLVQKARTCDIRKSLPDYTEPNFSEDLKVFSNKRLADGSRAQQKFIEKFPLRARPEKLSLSALEKRTKLSNTLPASLPKKPILASSRIEKRLNNFWSSAHVKSLKPILEPVGYNGTTPDISRSSRHPRTLLRPNL